MSSFPTYNPVIKSQVDDAVRRTRSSPVSDAVLNQRKVKRMSIDEINATDIETMRQKFTDARRDDRGPVETFLDLLDAPRNAVFNVLAPSLAAKSRGSGDVGTGGMGRVSGSDVLHEMGIKPGIVAGVLGFGLDMALDPLTYLGPAGWGARVATTSGRTARFGMTLAKDLKKGIGASKHVDAVAGAAKAVAEREFAEATAKHAAASKVAAAAGKAAPVAPVLRNTDNLRDVVLGGMNEGGSFVRRGFRAVNKALGADREYGGGLVREYAFQPILHTDPDDVRQMKEAISQLVEHYGAGMGPGVRIGREGVGKFGLEQGRVMAETAARGEGKVNGATSTVAHIPFTDIGIHVPAFTADAVNSAAGVNLSRVIHQTGVMTPEISDRIRDMDAAFMAADTTSRNLERYYADRDKFYQTHGENLENIAPQAEKVRVSNASPLFQHSEDTRAEEAFVREVEARHAQYHRENATKLDANLPDPNPLRAQMRADVDKIQEVLRRAEGQKFDNPLSALLMKKKADQLEAHVNYLRSVIDQADSKIKQYGGLKSEAARREKSVNQTLSDLAELDVAANQGRRVNPPLLGEHPDAPGIPHVYGSNEEIAAAMPRVREAIDNYKNKRDAYLKMETLGNNAVLSDETKHTEQMKFGTARDQAKAELEAAREELWTATAPYRNKASPTASPRASRTLEQYAAEAAERDRQLLREDHRKIFDTPESEMDSVEKLRDRDYDMMAASIMASMANRASATSMLTKDQERALQLSKMVLGTDDSIVGASAMTPMSTVMRQVFGSDHAASMDFAVRMDALARKKFGGNAGYVQDAIRRAAYMKDDGLKRRVSFEISRMQKDLQLIAIKAGILGSEEPIMSLALAMAYGNRPLGTLRTTDANGKLVGFAKRLQDAVSGGLLDEKKYPGIRQELERFNEKYKSLIHDPITEKELHTGVLRPEQVVGGYIGGHRLTREGERVLQTTQKSAVGDRMRVAKEDFLQNRTTGSAVFDSAKHGKVELFEADRIAQSYTPSEIAAMSEADRAETLRNRELFAEYDALADRPPMMENDPLRLNELVKGDGTTPGRFRNLFGVDEVPGGLFDTNYMTTTASRLRMHETAIANKAMDDIVENIGILLPASVTKAVAGPAGTAIDLGNGTKGTIVKLGENRNGLRIGNDVFRRLDDIVTADKSSPLFTMMGKNALGQLYHTRVADAIEAAYRIQNSPGYWQVLDKMTSIWKTTALLHPAYAIGNLIGDSLNATIGNPHFLKDVAKYGRDAAKFVWASNARDEEFLRGMKFDILGENVSGDILSEQLRGDRILGGNLWAEAPIHTSRLNTVLDSRLTSPGYQGALRPRAVRNDFAQIKAEEKAQNVPNAAANTNAAYGVANDRIRRYVLEPWHRVNEKAQDWTRLINYLSHRNQGFDHASSVNKVVESMFDYHSMTDFERNHLRRLIPFYSWLKNNGVYQAKMMMKRPIFVGALPSFQGALEEALNGDEVIPMNMRPQWMREALAIQLGTNPETRTAITAGTWLPQEQGIMLGKALTGGLEGMQDTAKDLVSGTNPFIRTGFEIASGRQIYSGKTIGPSTDTADVSIPGAVASNVRPLQEARKIYTAARETGAGGALTRLAIGGRSQPFTDARIASSLKRQYADEEAKLRQAIRNAEFKKDHATSLRIRVKLMKMYESQRNAGLAIPKWAEKALSGMRKEPANAV